MKSPVIVWNCAADVANWFDPTDHAFSSDNQITDVINDKFWSITDPSRYQLIPLVPDRKPPSPDLPTSHDDIAIMTSYLMLLT